MENELIKISRSMYSVYYALTWSIEKCGNPDTKDDVNKDIDMAIKSLEDILDNLKELKNKNENFRY